MRQAGSALGLLMVLATIGPGALLPRPALAASTAQMTVAITPRPLPADWTSRGSVRAQVTDATGAAMANQAATFTTTGNVTLVPGATTGSDGSATVTVLASTTAGAEPITATLVDGTATLYQMGRAPATTTLYSNDAVQREGGEEQAEPPRPSARARP